MRRKGNISKKCMVCIMSAMMMMSSVTGTMIAPMGVYAVDYETTDQVPEDEEHNRNLTAEDKLAVNTGTIHENNGTIVENAAGAKVEYNTNTIEKNYGEVLNNSDGTVGTNYKDGSVTGGEVNTNYGTVEGASEVTNNYGNATESNVVDNWASGKVTITGDNVVENNHGGEVSDDEKVINQLESNPGPNPYVEEEKPIDNPTDITSEVKPYTPESEENNEPPQPPAPNNIVGVKEIEDAITFQINFMPVASTSGEIMLDFGTDTNIDANIMYSLLTFTPEGRTSVDEPIFCSFKIDGVTYYLRVDRGTQVSADEIRAMFTANKTEGPMKIAEMFGAYGVSLVPGYDAVLKQAETEISSLHANTLKGFGFDQFHTKEDVDTILNRINNSYKRDIEKCIEDHKNDYIGDLSGVYLEAYYSKIFGDLKDGGKYKEDLNNEIELTKGVEQAFAELRKKHIDNIASIEKTLEIAKKSGPSCQTSDTGSLEKIQNRLNEAKNNSLVQDGRIPAEDVYTSEDIQTLVNKITKSNILEEAKNNLYNLQKDNKNPGTDELTQSLVPDDPHTADISPVNTGIARGHQIYAPVSNNLYIFDAKAYAASTIDKEVWISYIYQEEIDWYDDDKKLREMAALSDKGMEEVVYDAMKNKKGKWIRYDKDGKMLKGWVTIEGDLADIYPDQAGNTYYYDSVTGIMAKGVVTLNGVKYSFNEITGALEK